MSENDTCRDVATSNSWQLFNQFLGILATTIIEKVQLQNSKKVSYKENFLFKFDLNNLNKRKWDDDESATPKFGQSNLAKKQAIAAKGKYDKFSKEN